MIVLWTAILILTPYAPPPEVFRDICMITGGEDFKVLEGSVREEVTGRIYGTLTMHCIAPREPEKGKARV